jgi:hypothetical protein
MGYPQPPPFSPIVLLTLLLVVAASSVTFWLIVRRATSHRQWVAFSDWARDKGFRFPPHRTRQHSGPVRRAATAVDDPPQPRQGADVAVQIEAAGPAPAAAPGGINSLR